MNSFLNYYQGKKWKNDPGRATKVYLGTTHRETSSKQAAYHKALVDFMESKGLNAAHFKRYKDKQDCRGKISGMITTIRRCGYADEFFDKRGYENAEVEV